MSMVYFGTGRRKSAVARIRLTEGDGRITGQSIAGTDFTPLGSRAEGFKGGVFTGVASAFVVGLIANLLMNNKTKEDAPDGPNAPEDGGE